MMVLTRNGPKLIFYPGRHGLTRIDSVNSVLVKNDGFDPKRPETHFLPWSTWFDLYWLGELGFDQKWRFWPETTWNSFFTLVDMFWPVLTRWTRFWPENSFFTWPTWFDLYWPGGIGSYGKMRLTREKYFWILNFFLIFLDFYK